CPPHSHYEACSYGCPLSCGDLPVPGGCGSECHEGCVCDEGFALSGESCLPLASCGCVHQGTYHPPGQTFYPGPGCDSLCHCQEGGLVSCESSSCGPHEACQPSGGSLGCVAVGSSTCQASGDPHYTTFDGRRFDFMGTCVYVLAQTCGTRPGLHRFAVLQENVAWGNGRVSVTRVITVQVANFTLRLEQRQWKVTVNGVDMKLPVVLANGQIRASQHGSDVVIETDFGLRVAYDLVYYVRVTVPGNYYQQMCGLCGNYNGDPKDDFQKPNGSQAGNANEFGNSWEEVVPDSPCLPPTPCPPGSEGCNSSGECPPELEKKYQKEEFCGLLSSPTGPLSSCHKLVDPQGPLEDCVFDLCLGGGNLSILCSNIHAYVSACQAAGGHVEPWRNETFCPMECPLNSHYELCADTCSLGCSALSAPPQCQDGCAEGCQCDSGFLYNGQACVPIQQCGCYHNGVYYEPEQTVLIDNCQQQCTCHAGKGVVCQEHSCKPGQVCQPSGGILSCVTKDPCHGVTCRPQETCKEQGGQGVCLPNYEATCWLWGDPHYHSFDGRKFDFQGTCNYVLATTGCPGVSTQGLTPFTITTKNENRGNPAVSYVRVVTVAALGTNISIHKDEIGKVRVNGVLTALPVSVADRRISVTQGASKALLVADFGLQVSYDWNWRVDVTLPSSYHGAVCGLCGNMDRNPNNDQVFPNGTLAPSIPIWGGSWRAPGWDPLCWDECRGSCPTCPEDRLEQYEGPGFCGPLAPGTGGPFTTCHAHVPPESFFKGCVLDDLASYVARCQAAGIVIEDWRAQVGCEITLPRKHCRSPAPLTTSRYARAPCVEGCQCDAVADRCVPSTTAGRCWANGTYTRRAVSFGLMAPASAVSLRAWGGSWSAHLPAVGWVKCVAPAIAAHGCQPVSTAECQAWGDPITSLLDWHRFDFQGTCEYLLTMSTRGSQAVATPAWGQDSNPCLLRSPLPPCPQVDGVFVALPFQLDSLLHAHLSGTDVVVTTTSGLSLAFDGDSFVRLRVPAAYAGSLCGLCGNYNQDPADDLKAVGGKPAGWQVGGAQGCGECVSKPCPSPCTPEQQESFGGPDACGVISATDGPLAPCHGLVPPAQYFQGCLLDACQVQGHPGGLCPAVAAYVAACQAAGAQLGEWRRPDFCREYCSMHGPHSRVSPCPSQDCRTAAPSSSVRLRVHLPSRARYLLSGNTLGGEVSCEPSSCGPHETCRPSGGSLGCVAVGSTTCQASGDPHYTTFDGRRFDFMGTCVYVLAQTCGTRPGLHRFAVLQENVAWGNGRVSVTRVITVQVANFTLRLEQRQWKVTVNGVDMKLPVVLANGQIRASQHGSDVVIETDFGLRVAYDLLYYVRVTVPGNYYQQMCGLCGNYNGNPKDDFQKPNGSQAGNANEFGNSWEEVVPDSPCLPPPTCPPGSEGCNSSGECPPELEKKYQKEEFCGLLSSPRGPLASCHKLVDPQGPLEDCIFDLCLGGGNLSILCSNIHAYVSACQAAGGHVEPWRNETFCPMECPLNSHYELCADTCSLGCSALSAPLQCPDGCAEGCQCDSGFLYNG
uniref:Fc gamma binding protein n=1 Tax=Pan troglodytes TaxID=9598 RepID=H2QGB7_PANTR